MSQTPQENRRNTKGEVDGRPRSRRRGMNHTAKIALAVVGVIGAAVLVSFFVLQMVIDVSGINKPDQQIEIHIEDGMSSWEIAKLLEEKGVIEQALTFRLYSSIKNKNAYFLAGDYILNSHMGYDEIIVALKTGDTIKEEVTITFYEGMTALDIAKLLEKEGVCDSDEFLQTLDSETFDFEFEDMLPENELRFHKLEGYLFPDTYDFYKNENVKSVIRKFLRNFQNRVFPDVYGQIQDAGMTLDEAITLASLIQAETGGVNEETMAHVSSIFHNRLDSQTYPQLQSDVTIFYVENDIKPLLDRANQEMYDAYNTYTCTGLPVGPICSPGLDAIIAAANPADTSDYFFVTDVDGNYYYAADAQQHYANVRKASSVGSEHGIATQQ